MNGTFDNRSYEVGFSAAYLFVPSRREICGIYAISGDYRDVSQGNDGACLYIGSSVDVNRRTMRDHFPHLRAGNHDNAKLQNAWSAHGGDAFTVFVLEECSRDTQILVQREQAWMDFYRDQHGPKVLFNIAPEAGRIELTEEDRYKAALRGKLRWTGIGNPMFGSQRFGDKNPFNGREHTPETKARLSSIAKERFKDKENHPQTGRVKTAAEREHLRRIHTGMTHTAEARAKVSAFFKGRPNLRNRKPPVRQIDASTGQTIKVWPCALEAAKALGLDTGCIGRCADGRRDSKGRQCLTVGGFRWERVIGDTQS